MILSSDNIFTVVVHLCRFGGETTRVAAAECGVMAAVQYCTALISFRPGPSDSQRTSATNAKENNENFSSNPTTPSQENEWLTFWQPMSHRKSRFPRDNNYRYYYCAARHAQFAAIYRPL